MPSSITPDPSGPLTPERLVEIRDLLRYESSIAFYSSRAKESMLLLLAEAEEAVRLRAEHEPYEPLTEQGCPDGKHVSWLVDSPDHHACPWCEIDLLRAESAARPTRAEIVAWLVKKAREHRAQGPQYAKQADVIGTLASKVHRGAIRPDNLRTLEPGQEPAAEDVPTLLAEIDRLRRERDLFANTLNGTARMAGRQANEIERLRSTEGGTK